MRLLCLLIFCSSAMAVEGNPRVEEFCSQVSKDVYEGMVSAGLQGKVAASGAHGDCMAFHKHCLEFEKDVFNSCADYGEEEQMKLVPEWHRALITIQSPGIADNNHKGVLVCQKMSKLRTAQLSNCETAVGICRKQSKVLDYGAFAKTIYCDHFSISRHFSAQIRFGSTETICSAGESEKDRINEKKATEYSQCAAIFGTRGTASTGELIESMNMEDPPPLKGGYDPVEELRRLDGGSEGQTEPE